MRIEKTVYLILCGLLFSYILLRCINVPLVHDEVATYVHYVLPQEFIPGYCLVDANNHILNSALCIVSTDIFGVSPLSLRLASLLGFLLLAVYLSRIAMQFKEPVLRWSFILALLGSHYFMEFYALSRGYGLSMAFLLGAIFHLQKYIKEGQYSSLLKFSVLLLLGLASNLSILFPLIMLLAILGAHLLIQKKNFVAWSFFLANSLIIGLFVRYSFWLKNNGALYYGGGGDFWKITMKTLSLYLGGDDKLLPMLFVIAALCCLVAIIANAKFSAKKFDFSKWVFHITLLGSLLGVFAAHLFMDTNYPEDRVGLYLYPLLIGAFIVSIQSLSQSIRWLKWTSLVLLYFPLHFLVNVNITHVDFWFRERIPDEFYDELESFERTESHFPLLSGYHTTALTYFMKGKLQERNVPAMVFHDFPNQNADYIITRVNEEGMSFPEFTLVSEDLPSGNKLWKRTIPSHREEIHHEGESGLSFDDKYYDILRIPVIGDRMYGVDLSIEYHTNGEPIKLEAVLNIKDSEGTDIAYIPYALHWRQKGSEVNARTTLFAKGNAEVENEILLYLWNRESGQILDLSYDVSLFSID